MCERRRMRPQKGRPAGELSDLDVFGILLVGWLACLAVRRLTVWRVPAPAASHGEAARIPSAAALPLLSQLGQCHMTAVPIDAHRGATVAGLEFRQGPAHAEIFSERQTGFTLAAIVPLVDRFSVERVGGRGPLPDGPEEGARNE